MRDEPQPDKTLALHVQRQFNGICDRFEAAWKEGARPRIEAFLTESAGLPRTELLSELLLVELAYRCRLSERPVATEYEQRFPLDLALIRAVFSDFHAPGDSPSDVVLFNETVIHSAADEIASPTSGDGIAVAGAAPLRFGRYEVTEKLGEGGFGVVYRGHDTELRRDVAIKVARRGRIATPADAEDYLAEARAVANLDHPHIVPVYDVGSTPDFPCFVVSKYIEGADLSATLKCSRLSSVQAAELVATVAEALHYAHKQGLVHRDVKPGNILLDKSGRPFVVDFGLALREQDFGKGGPKSAGTPAYMSPEQARGEGHRVDGRSDIFSLGVVFYEMLVGRKPFTGDIPEVLLEQIATCEPRPPRQYDESTPKELERICLKALAKRAVDRHTTAFDLADDLRHWLAQQATGEEEGRRGRSGEEGNGDAEASNPVRVAADFAINSKSAIRNPRFATTPSSDSRPIKIVPKGLRSFDEHDANFFLELLPGPRDRDGLPDSLRFWITKIEETDADKTFLMGLIYGPSGCGKSSLVKAGLLPRLSDDVIVVYLEATAAETELRLLNGLRKRCPALPDKASLQETLALLRRGHGIPAGKKVLIVLDQFEQWLHAKKEEANTQLVQALRQCDGAHLQCVVAVRDDFWMAVVRFLGDMEVELVQGQNFAAVDLFPNHHAQKVLAACGRAFGALPDDRSQTSDEQLEFLKQAVAGLTEAGMVICVRLALFAEMMKTKEWTPTTLKEVGGTAGVGVNFLEETFSSRTANPKHRLHQKAARGVLKALLPDSGADIKGHMRSRHELLEASGYAQRPREFDELLRILDGELRLVTPADEEEARSAEPTHLAGAPVRSGEDQPPHDEVTAPSAPHSALRDPRSYQLTHDYLVHSLRDWLTRKQRETRRGRAELRLEDRANLWNAKPENRHLPSWRENLGIRMLTDKQRWSEQQRKMMGKAAQVHGLRSLVVATLLISATAIGVSVRSAVVREQDRIAAANREKHNQTRAEGMVAGLMNADIAQVRAIVKDIDGYRNWADPLLREAFEKAPAGSREKLHSALALLPVDEALTEYLSDELLRAEAAAFPVIRNALDDHSARINNRLWTVLAGRESDPHQQRLRAAGALAKYDSGNAQWIEVAQEVANQLVSVNPVFVGQWQEALRAVAQRLLHPLATIFNDPEQTELPRTLATSLLADYAKDDPDVLTNLVIDADSKAFGALFPALQRHEAAAVEKLQAVLDRKVEADWNDPPLDTTWTDPPAAARAAIEAAHGILAERFAFCQDLAWDEFRQLAEGLRPCGLRPTRVRPWRGDDKLRVAAVWTRDGKRWKLETDLTWEQLPQGDAPAEEGGLVPADVAVLPLVDPAAERPSVSGGGLRGVSGGGLRFVLLWGEAATGEQRRLLVDASEPELVASQAALTKQGFAAQTAVGVWTDTAGQRHYLGIWSNHGAPAELRAAYGGFELMDQPQWDAAVAPAERQFPTLVERSEPPARYAAVWRADVTVESHLVEPTSPVLQLERARELAVQGFRPVSTCVSAQAALEDGSQADPTVSTVWHRPLVPDTAKEQLAERQATAAAALLRMGATERVWPLFEHRPDPRLRSYLLDRLATYGDEPGALLSQLKADSDVSRRRALNLAIGQFARAKLLSAEQMTSAVTVLAGWYADDPDAGIHGAAEWSLRQLGAHAKIAQVCEAYATGSVVGERQWYLSKEGGQTLVIVRPAEEFLMGSPVAEAERFQGPVGKDETRHRRRIGRTFAIGAHEVTVEQFERFRPEHGFDRTKSREPGAPANMVNWYDAAAFCNWLSEREGIAREQWCYDPKQTFAEGMVMVPDYLQREGYRLPSEAEWEYACRAGATTARYFGETQRLLGEYAWYAKNSQDRWLLPVGNLKPNDLGLFDTIGNANEWCQDLAISYSKDRAWMEDQEQVGAVSNSQSRVLRGGAYVYSPLYVRSANRYYPAPTYRTNYTGFRVARTYRSFKSEAE